MNILIALLISLSLLVQVPVTVAQGEDALEVQGVPKSLHFSEEDPHVELIETEEESLLDGARRSLTSSQPVGKITFHWDCKNKLLCYKLDLRQGITMKKLSVEVSVGGSLKATNHFTSQANCMSWSGSDYVTIVVKLYYNCYTKSGKLYCFCATSNPIKVETKTCDSDGNGDPHFTTWDGTHFSYHGACDMVFAKSPTFADGLGLDLQIRTEIKADWSRISNAAVKIGDDILEVLVDGSHYFNGVHHDIEDSPDAIAHYPLHTLRKCRGVVDSGCRNYKFFYQIDLGRGEMIEITAFKGFVNVEVKSPLDEFIGLMGTSGKVGMIDRDGQTVLTDPIAMASAWQVRDNEPMIFHDVVAPQYPEPCLLPEANARKSLIDTAARAVATADGRRALRGNLGVDNDALHDQAIIACQGANNFEGCVMDVLATNDLDMALIYVDNEDD